jgi:Asp-tRNA(Asn)/Glu-tRNA(Gln) amidotransferase A subunit family amidase
MHGMTLNSTALQKLRASLVSRETSPQTIAEHALARANSNASRNVYISLQPEWTLREVETLSERFGNAAEPLLYALPVSLKDCFDLAGFVTTCGSKFYAQKNGIAREDSGVAERLRAQGAVIVGKTHMHPLAYGITGENPEYGDCVQPKDATLLTGGSSSGAAASVQEGSALAAIGTDTGGSIRAPAALCGLAGYRASIELAHQCGLWRGGAHLAPSFDTLGWLFRDLKDGPLLAEALFGLSVSMITETRVRIGCVGEGFLHDCEPGALHGLQQWRDRLTESGAELVPFEAEFWNEAMSIYAPIQANEAAAIHDPKTGGDFSHFEPSIAERLRWGAALTADEIESWRLKRAAFCERTDALLREYDFLIAPCAPVCRLKADADHRETRRLILRYTTPISLGGYPAVTLPAEGGAGVQLVAMRGADARLLAFAAALGS